MAGRPLTCGEELAGSISHGVGLAAGQLAGCHFFAVLWYAA